MTDGSNDLFQYPLPKIIDRKILSYSAKPYSSTIGIIRFLVKPGQVVKKEQPIAKIYNAFGKLQETMQTIEAGIVLGHSDTSVAFPGKPIMAFGIIEV
jgi:predicted deacylase